VVHEPERPGLLGGDRSAVQDLAHRVGGETATLADDRDRLLDQRSGEPAAHLTVGIADGRGRVRLGGRLVLLALAELRVHPDLLEPAAQQDHVDVHAAQHDTAGRLQPDRRCCSRQPVREHPRGQLAERLGVRDGRLVLAEVSDRGTDLVHH
jgi:hypothetical protein